MVILLEWAACDELIRKPIFYRIWNASTWRLAISPIVFLHNFLKKQTPRKESCYTVLLESPSTKLFPYFFKSKLNIQGERERERGGGELFHEMREGRESGRNERTKRLASVRVEGWVRAKKKGKQKQKSTRKTRTKSSTNLRLESSVMHRGWTTLSCTFVNTEADAKRGSRDVEEWTRLSKNKKKNEHVRTIDSTGRASYMGLGRPKPFLQMSYVAAAQPKLRRKRNDWNFFPKFWPQKKKNLLWQSKRSRYYFKA